MRWKSWAVVTAVLFIVHGNANAQDTLRTSEHRFVASSRGQVYYPLACNSWRSLAVSNLRYFRTAVDAERAGYTPTTAQACAPMFSAIPRIQPRIGGSANCVVSRVVDGDTFACSSGDVVRLLLIDSPEIAEHALADSARRALLALIPLGTPVRLEFDVELHDRYDRLLAYVYRGSEFVNRLIARSGLATSIVIPPNVKHVQVIRAAVDSAQRERIGLWRQR